MTYKEIISNLRMAQSFHCQNYNICNAIEEAIALVISKRDGLMIESPCKVGDNAYFIWNFYEPEIQDCEVKRIQLEKNGTYAYLDYIDCIGHHNEVPFLIGNLNSSWFLSKEKAEARLKELLESA